MNSVLSGEVGTVGKLWDQGIKWKGYCGVLVTLREITQSFGTLQESV